LPKIVVDKILEVVLRHDTDAVCTLVNIVHILASAMEILKSYGEVRSDVAEGVAEDILATLVLIIR
jgi:hypothetical protein